MDRILSHAGSKSDTVFEIQWKSGDITWLPYYQITHLRALTEYLDLLGKKSIKELPKGTGKPPLEDPQLFLGTLTLDSPPISSPSYPVSHSYKNIIETLVADHCYPDINSTSQHNLYHTLFVHTPLTTTWPRLVNLSYEESTTRISSVYHQPYIDYATLTNPSVSLSMSPKSPSIFDLMRKYVNSLTTALSTPTRWVTSSSADSGTMEHLLVTNGDLVASTWPTTPGTTKLNPLTIPHTFPTSTLLQPKSASPLTSPSDPLMPLRIILSTNTPLSWPRGKRSSERSLRSVANRGFGPSTRASFPHSKRQTTPPTSVAPRSIPGSSN